MSCEWAALLFQAHANYGTWSIDFGLTIVLSTIWNLETYIAKLQLAFHGSLYVLHLLPYSYTPS